MKIISGRQVYTTLEEKIHPSHTALIVVDVQKDYVPGGSMGKEDRDPQGSNYDFTLLLQMMPRLKNLIEQARNFGTQVVYIQSTTLPENKTASPSWMHFWHVRWGLPENVNRVLDGTKGHEVADEIAPQEGDITVRKYRPSAFVGTPLQLILQSNHIDSIIVTGLATEGCVLATASVGWYNDFYVTLAKDCVSTSDQHRHETALEVMSYMFDVIPSDDIIACWQSSSTESKKMTA